MWRLLFLFSAIAIAAVLIARWWFGLRVLLTEGKRPCRCDLARWMPSPEDAAVIHRAEGTADEFGKQLRQKALAEWKELDPKGAASRESSQRFGLAVPPLSGIVALMAMFVAKIPIFGALAAFLAATSLSAVLGMLSLAPELQAIMSAARKLRENKSFPNRDDEDAVIQCAIAHAWKESIPPILKMIQK
ncbi:MAG: hypothetical protein ABIT37_19080 [Luteolibacter sp.]